MPDPVLSQIIKKREGYVKHPLKRNRDILKSNFCSEHQAFCEVKLLIGDP